MSDYPRVSVHQRNTVRLITTGRLKPPALAPLARDQAGFDALCSLESATNGRLQAQQTGLPDLDPRELVFGLAGHTFINAAFTHTRPGGNRFNDENRGAWYCAFDAETALAEVVFHMTRELTAINRFDTTIEYTELLADFSAEFLELRGATPAEEPALSPDPGVGYPAGQALAKRLRADGGAGIIYPSVRHPGGTCIAALHPSLVQNFRQGYAWRVLWRGSRVPETLRL